MVCQTYGLHAGRLSRKWRKSRKRRKRWRQLGKLQTRSWVPCERQSRKPWKWWNPRESRVQTTGSPNNRFRNTREKCRQLWGPVLFLSVPRAVVTLSFSEFKAYSDPLPQKFLGPTWEIESVRTGFALQKARLREIHIANDLRRCRGKGQFSTYACLLGIRVQPLKVTKLPWRHPGKIPGTFPWQSLFSLGFEGRRRTFEGGTSFLTPNPSHGGTPTLAGGLQTLEVSNGRSLFAAIRIAIGAQRFDIAQFESQPQNPFKIAVMSLRFFLTCLGFFFFFRFASDSVR